jgi:hypothetical protein
MPREVGGVEVAPEETLHDFATGSVCDWCAERCEGNDELNALSCTFAECPASAAVYHQDCLEKYLKTIKLEKCARAIAVPVATRRRRRPRRASRRRLSQFASPTAPPARISRAALAARFRRSAPAHPARAFAGVARPGSDAREGAAKPASTTGRARARCASSSSTSPRKNRPQPREKRTGASFTFFLLASPARSFVVPFPRRLPIRHLTQVSKSHPIHACNEETKKRRKEKAAAVAASPEVPRYGPAAKAARKEAAERERKAKEASEASARAEELKRLAKLKRTETKETKKAAAARAAAAQREAMAAAAANARRELGCVLYTGPHTTAFAW